MTHRTLSSPLNVASRQFTHPSAIIFPRAYTQPPCSSRAAVDAIYPPTKIAPALYGRRENDRWWRRETRGCCTHGALIHTSLHYASPVNPRPRDSPPPNISRRMHRAAMRRPAGRILCAAITSFRGELYGGFMSAPRRGQVVKSFLNAESIRFGETRGRKRARA